MAGNGPELAEKLTLLSAWFCPYAQRVWMALCETYADFNYHEVSLKDKETGLWFQAEQKPQWFLKLNPKGLVPVLAYKEGEQAKSVYESLDCLKFLDALLPEHPLLPKEELMRQKAQQILDRFEEDFVPAFYRLLLVHQDTQSQQECRAKLKVELEWLEEQFTGPFFLGEAFSAVDCALLPFFLRCYVLDYYRNFTLPDSCNKLQGWVDRCKTRSSVVATMWHPEGEDYHTALGNHYEKYADGTANSLTAKLYGAKLNV